jgi:hypothetical protein
MCRENLRRHTLLNDDTATDARYMSANIVLTIKRLLTIETLAGSRNCKNQCLRQQQS